MCGIVASFVLSVRIETCLLYSDTKKRLDPIMTLPYMTLVLKPYRSSSDSFLITIVLQKPIALDSIYDRINLIRFK